MTEFEQREIISKNLKKLIDSSGKDQKQIAIELGVNPPTFNQWVNGKAVPLVSTLRKIAEYFNVRLEALINEDAEYYFDEKTAEVAQELFEDKNLRMLFSAARDSRPEDLQMAADLLMRLKQTNKEG